MKYNSSTLYNWLSDDSCSKTQLHIYAVESEEEYLELSAMIDEYQWGIWGGGIYSYCSSLDLC